MSILVELVGILLLLLSSLSIALGLTADTVERSAFRYAFGAITILAFRLYRSLAILKIERDALIAQMKRETQAIETALTSQRSNEELCRIVLQALSRPS